MPVNLYYGDPRQGKSYEVVTEVIANALLQGRRVVNNIRGVNQDLIKQYLSEKHKKDISEFGEVVQYDKSQLVERGFFCSENREGFVKPGDLVVVDECWNIWPSGSKVHPEVTEFFRMHGHYAHEETGITCDVVLITQVPRKDLSWDILEIVDVAFYVFKLKNLGFDSKYTVQIYNKFPKYRDKPLRELTKSYDKSKFDWYKSHTHSNAKELVIDDRRNIFNGFLFRYVMPAALIAVLGSIWFVYDFLTGGGSKEDIQDTSIPAADLTDLPSAPAPGQISQTSINSVWYATGYIYRNGYPIFFISDGFNHRTLMAPESFEIMGRSFRVKDQDQWYSNFSRSDSSSASQSNLLPTTLR